MLNNVPCVLRDLKVPLKILTYFNFDKSEVLFYFMADDC